jgi:hypothetical protein
MLKVKISRGVNTLSYGAFVSPLGGLGGPPSFVACQSISVVAIELWAVEAFCLTPVIACLFFVAGVLSMLEMQGFQYVLSLRENRKLVTQMFRFQLHIILED